MSEQLGFLLVCIGMALLVLIVLAVLTATGVV